MVDFFESLALRYGLNPHQLHAQLISPRGSGPLEVLSGSPGYINMLDALRGWQLVRELRSRFGKPAAASFKHVNPAGAALGGHILPADFWTTHFLREMPLSPLATAYLRARHCDRISSYGDFVALSDVVDVETAEVLKVVASDGVIAPGFTTEALGILQRKREGRYIVVAIDPDFKPAAVEGRSEFGLTLIQGADNGPVADPRTARIVSTASKMSEADRDDLLLAAIVARHTRSNAVVIALQGQTIGIGAGQQSRIAATRLACAKADTWRLLAHPALQALSFRPDTGRIEKINLVDMVLRFDELADSERCALADCFPSSSPLLKKAERDAFLRQRRSLCLASDAFIPFRDNVDRASQSHVTHIIQTGGSLRDDGVTCAADEYGIVMLHTGQRYFLH